jgi:predicted NBD/HSP70 family sugar kinase
MGSKNKHNSSNIFKELYYHKSLSCLELSEKISKSLPNTMKQLNGLIEKRIVVKSGHAPSTGGRKPQVYSLRADFMYMLAVSVDQFIVRMAFMDIHNNKVSEVSDFQLQFYHNPNYAVELSNSIEEYILKTGISKDKIAGIGIGMPGFIDSEKGINYSVSGNSSVAAVIHERTRLKVYIDNDSSLIGLAEQRFGSAAGIKNAMVINIGWGVGLGLILNGELFRGANGFAGEFSHIPLFANNKLCSCGKYGCLETETALSVIVEKAKDGLLKGKLSSINKQEVGSANIEQAFNIIKDAALKGDKFAIEVFSEAGYNIGRGVAILIHLLNPDVVVLSGRGSLAGKIWQAPIQQALNEHCIPRLSENTGITISTLGYEAELMGAAALVMERFGEDNLESRVKEHKQKAIV